MYGFEKLQTSLFSDKILDVYSLKSIWIMALSNSFNGSSEIWSCRALAWSFLERQDGPIGDRFGRCQNPQFTQIAQKAKKKRPRWLVTARTLFLCVGDSVPLLLASFRQTLQGSFSAVSKPNFASKYTLESSRRDLHNALLCTALKITRFLKLC